MIIKEAVIIIKSINTKFLKNLARYQNKSVYDLSDGITPVTIYKIFNGTTDCRTGTFIKLLNALDINKGNIKDAFIFDKVSKKVNEESD